MEKKKGKKKKTHQTNTVAKIVVIEINLCHQNLLQDLQDY